MLYFVSGLAGRPSSGQWGGHLSSSPPPVHLRPDMRLTPAACAKGQNGRLNVETNMTKLHRLGLVFLILISCTGCDQMTKNIARESLASSAPISILNGLVRVEYTENPGAILGLGANLPSEIRLLFFIIFVSVVLTLTLAFAINTHSLGLMQIAGLSLIAAGGIGNLLDRLFNNGLVIDFVSLGIGPLRTGIFNLADVAIFGGVAIFLLAGAKGQRAKSAPFN